MHLDLTSEKVKIASHKKYKDDLNEIWHVLDPDRGGIYTWSKEAEYAKDPLLDQATHIRIKTVIYKKTLDIIKNGDAYDFMNHINEVSNHRERKMPSFSNDSNRVEKVFNSLILNDDLILL